MGSKNNPKNRGVVQKNKVFNGKEVEPIVFYDTENKKKYLSVKVCKSTDVVCEKNGEPMKWENIKSEN